MPRGQFCDGWGARFTFGAQGAMPDLEDGPVTVSGALGNHEIAPGTIAIVDAANPDDDVVS